MKTSEFLKKIRQIEIKSRELSQNIFAGQYHSIFKGRGMIFSKVREYEFGDDVRNIDWNVTARYFKPFVKVFEEERELIVVLLIDVSGSKEFGTQGMIKKDIINEIAATLAFSAMQNNDKIGIIFFSDKIEKFIPPQKGRKHILYIIRELINFKPINVKTDITQVLQYLTNTIKKHCTIFLISDFIDNHNYQHSINIVNRKHDITAIQVFDNRETEIPNVGLMKIYDAESGKEEWIDTTSSKVRQIYKQWWIHRQTEMESAFKKAHVDFVSIRTDENYVKALINLFNQRN